VSFRVGAGVGTSFLCAALVAGCAHVQDAPESRLKSLERAKALLRDGYPDRAVPLLAELASRTDGDFEIARLLVEAHVRANRTGELLAKLQSQSIETAVSHYMLALARVAGSTREGMPRSSAETAAELERAIALSPGETELHYRLGVALLELGRYARAVDSLRRALELNPERTTVYLPLAKAWNALGNTSESLQALNQWVSRHPKEEEVKIAKALAEEIAPTFASLPSGSEARFARGLALIQQADDPLAAIAIFDELQQEHPQVPIAHTMLALCYQRLDDAGRAIDELQQAAAMAPGDGRNHYYLGELYLARGQARQAKDEFQLALALNPLLDEPHLRLGELALEESDFKSATTHLGAAALLSTKLAPRAKLARALQLDGNYTGADRELRRLVEMEPHNPDWMLQLGLLHVDEYAHTCNPERRARSRAEAIRWLRDVLRVQGDNVAAASALEKLGDG
jgi:tetratricopeptide (TPR) repeat protein